MEYAYLSSTVSIKTVSEDEKNGVFEVEGFSQVTALRSAMRCAGPFVVLARCRGYGDQDKGRPSRIFDPAGIAGRHRGARVQFQKVAFPVEG